MLELPPDETGPVPVTYTRAETSYYGVTPTRLVLGLAGAGVALAIALFATGHWPVGLVLLGLALLLVLVGAETGAMRARAGVAADSVATRGRATRRVLSLRRELRRLAAQRARLLFELGDAVYRDDEQATDAARGQVSELDELVQRPRVVAPQKGEALGLELVERVELVEAALVQHEILLEDRELLRDVADLRLERADARRDV